jgi:hypothetical protein
MHDTYFTENICVIWNDIFSSAIEGRLILSHEVSLNPKLNETIHKRRNLMDVITN